MEKLFMVITFSFVMSFRSPALAGASISLVLDVNVDRVLEVTTELLGLLLEQRVSSDDYKTVNIGKDLEWRGIACRTYPRKPAQR